ncbi:hypothetical protein F5Y10DRAFT_290230 [Nemania abortiva]|nr:hypothetical protein F5Y10DRAFT_290230 [Nemania abortiva]
MELNAGLFQAAPTSRLRVLKHLNKQKVKMFSKTTNRTLKAINAAGEDDDPNAPKELEAGFMQLYSYYAPAMQGGIYTIDIRQLIEHPDGKQTLDLKSTQSFNVNAPRFALPSGIVHSTYPPQGLGDHNNVLPHIVFNDPHLPWEQQGSPSQDKIDKDEENEEGGKRPLNKVPWIALLSFTEDELKLDTTELRKRSEGGLFPEEIMIPSKSDPAVREQNKATFSVQLTMSEYLEMGGNGTVLTPIQDDGEIDRDAQVDVIFLRPSNFESLVVGYDETDSPKPGQSEPDLSRYAYLAHVRNVNTRNVAGAGLDDNGLYSIVHAHRSGPLDLTAAKPLIVHLVSLEGIEQNITLPLKSDKRIALVSLYSWTYLCLPPEEANFIDSMRHIGFSIEKNQCWLRTPDEVIAKVTSSSKAKDQPEALPARLMKRMSDGYCLQRYMLSTGEETMSFYRGPLTPTWVPPIGESWWPFQSNFSTDYQILDKALGAMDITYSAAWQLGKTLGIADQVFTSALVRLRSSIQTTGRRDSLKKMTTRTVNSKGSTLASIRESMHQISRLSTATPGERPSIPQNRYNMTTPKELVYSRSANESRNISVPADLAFNSLRRSHIATATSRLGSARLPSIASADLLSGDDELEIPFNDINVPNSTDWQIVQGWILDNLFLKNIPAHYLIPDPYYLPPESIRFFYIDTNWMDAFIDGALSIGNHLDRQDDVVRQALKRNLNRYFESKYHNEQGSELNYHPQIPCFGFLLRSAVVKAFPDLQIHAPWAKVDDLEGEREPTLRYETIEKDTLLCLFDRMPGSAHWDTDLQITLSQPPHQQCFRIGGDGGLTSSQVDIEFPAVYTTTQSPPNNGRYDPLRVVRWTKDEKGAMGHSEENADNYVPIKDITLPSSVFDWNSRMLIFPACSSASYNVLTHDMTKAKAGGGSMKYFEEPGPTSAVVGTVLTSHVSKMKIALPRTTITDAGGLPPDYTRTPRHIRLPDDASDNPDDWVIVPPPADDDADKPPTPIDPPAPPHASPPARPPGKPTGIPSSFAPDAKPPIPGDEISHLPDMLLPQITPQFKFVCFPLGQPPPKFLDPPVEIRLPEPDSEADHAIDFVFGITLLPSILHDEIHKFQLYSVVITIPVGDKPTDLISSYQGSGAKMLSNLRFNAHCANGLDGDQEFLSITLIPRSTTKLIPSRKTPDISFVLWQARLNGVKGHATIKIQENYRRQTFRNYSVHFALGAVLLGKVVD